MESGSLNLIALSSRLYKTCWIFRLSALTFRCFVAKTNSMKIFFCVQTPSKDAATLDHLVNIMNTSRLRKQVIGVKFILTSEDPV